MSFSPVLSSFFATLILVCPKLKATYCFQFLSAVRRLHKVTKLLVSNKSSSCPKKLDTLFLEHHI